MYQQHARNITIHLTKIRSPFSSFDILTSLTFVMLEFVQPKQWAERY